MKTTKAMFISAVVPAVVVLSASLAAQAGTVVKITGQIVDAGGKPVAGARISESWSTAEGKPLETDHPAITDAAGKFSVEMEFYQRDRALLAFDGTGKLGAVAIVSHKTPEKPLRIQLSPLSELRFRYGSEEPAHPISESFLTLLLTDGTIPLVWGRSRASAYSIKLPAGRYTIRGEGGGDWYKTDMREAKLEPGKPLDVGEIKLPLSTIARLYGQPAPAWHFADVRGVPRDVQPASFKADALPEFLIDLLKIGLILPDGLERAPQRFVAIEETLDVAMACQQKSFPLFLGQFAGELDFVEMDR
jgi:hypothetical protein